MPILTAISYYIHHLLHSLVEECWRRVRDVPGLIPSQWHLLTKYIITNVMDKIRDRNPSKSEVIGRFGGDEKKESPHRTDKSRTLNNNTVHCFWNIWTRTVIIKIWEIGHFDCYSKPFNSCFLVSSSFPNRHLNYIVILRTRTCL